MKADIKRKTAKNKLVLNNIKPESYAIYEYGYVLYKDKINTESKQIIREILRPYFHGGFNRIIHSFKF